jgi:hypothetical protein
MTVDNQPSPLKKHAGIQPHSGKYPSKAEKVIHIYALHIQTMPYCPEIRLTVWITISYILKIFIIFFMISRFDSSPDGWS